MKVSVIVPTAGRLESLSKCLNSLIKQSFSQSRYEIIVVFDCVNPPENFVENIGVENLRVVVNNKNKGPAAARNKGVSVARGDIVAFTDDDCIADKNWVRIMYEAHLRFREVACIGGNTVTRKDNFPARISQNLSNSSIFFKGYPVYFPTCNISFKKAVFGKYKFNESFRFPAGEDLEFGWRLLKEGFKLKYIPQAMVLHDCHKKGYKSFIRQSYLYGRGNFTVASVHPDHVLLKDLKTRGTDFLFFLAKNIFSVFRFSKFMTRRAKKDFDFDGHINTAKLYMLFLMHRFCYCLGWIRQYVAGSGAKLYLTQIPFSLVLVITHRCNLSCRICDIWQTSADSEDMATAEIIDIIRQAHQQDIPEICFSGGEPLMHKDIFTILKFLEHEKIKNIGLLTNGILVDANFDKLKPYIAANIINPLVSLDSLEPKVHQYLRNSTSCWTETTNALRKLSRLKKAHKNVSFHVITIVCRDNLRELADIASFAYKLGAETIQFQCLLPNNMHLSERTKNSFAPTTEDERKLLHKAMHELIALKKEYPKFIKNTEMNLAMFEDYYFGDKKSLDKVVCFSADRTILVASDGSYSSCFGSYGNMRHDSLKDVLASKKRFKIAKKVKRKCKKPCVLPCFCDVDFMEN